MEYGICLHSVIPVRAEPSHKSEMITQVLFGELYHITEKENTWFKIIAEFDHYQGWIDTLQANLIDEQEYMRLTGAETAVTSDLVQLLSCENKRSVIPVVIGSSLPEFDKQRFQVGPDVYYYEGLVSGSPLGGTMTNPQNSLKTRKQLVGDAMLYMKAPYMWGGRSPFGIDCSGFVQMVYKLQGLKLLRDSTQQATQGVVVSLLAEAEPGDLAFFDDPEGNIIHVGILIDHQHIIHCSGQVQIDTLDHEGIYNTKLQRYTHKLRLVKRII